MHRWMAYLAWRCNAFGTGYVYNTPTAEATVALKTYYNPTITDNVLLADGVQPPAGYSFVQIEGYGAPGNGSLQNLYQFVQSAPKADHWAAGGAMVANASADPRYHNTGVIAQVREWHPRQGMTVTSSW